MNNQPEISEDVLREKTESIVDQTEITFLPFPEKALKALGSKLHEITGTGVSLAEFSKAYVLLKQGMSPPTYQFAFLNTTGYSQKIFLSDPFLWPVRDYYEIVLELLNYKKTGIVA